MNNKIATVFGATGFVGTQIVRELAARGMRVKVATRVPERAYFLKPCGAVGQVVPTACNYSEHAIEETIKGSDIVINCIGILYQRGKNSFQRIHTDLPATIAKACTKHSVGRFIHISALGIDSNTSKYAQSKLAGEQAIFENYKSATILRPSIIFGEDDNFFNMFAHLSRFLPALPLIGGGKTKFQPVFVGDVADAVLKTLENPKTKAEIYELAGSEILSFKELFEKMFKYTGRPRALVPLPFFIAKIDAFFMSILPKPLLTPDQVQSLKYDNVLSGEHKTLANLGIETTALDIILPRYLTSYRTGGRFSDSK